jgi:dimethylaniline monooxygenase (N-oxide forming)
MNPRMVYRLVLTFQALIDQSSIFWRNGVAGVLHHADFYPLVAEKVQVHRAKVQKLLPSELYLDDDEHTHFPCDAILCGTGWHRGLDMFSDEMKRRLGIPYPILQKTESDERWDELVASADATVTTRFPILRNPPPHPYVEPKDTPFRLYRGMAPLHDDSILFMNHIVLANKLFAAEGQAMWAVAWFDNKITVPLDTREQRIAMWTAWCKRRYLSNGSLADEASFDMVPYVDTLLEDMNLNKHRGKGWVSDFFGTVMPADLGRAWTEYLERERR